MVADAGGSYVLCDTDSMAIVANKEGGMVACPGGPHHLADGREAVSALSWDQTETIRQRFASLNPYDRSIVPGSVLQRVYDKTTGKPLHMAAKGELRCVAISAKRYAIFDAYQGASHLVDYGEGTEGDESQLANARVLKFSEHGLGAYLNPADPKSGAHTWIVEGFWASHIRSIETGKPMILPGWAKRMAVRQLTISTPIIARSFSQFNASVGPAERVRPFSFCLSASVAGAFGAPPGVDPNSFHLIGRYERDARKWARSAWFNLHKTMRRNGSAQPHREPPGVKFRVVAANADNGGMTYGQGTAQIQSIGAILRPYAHHPEAKSAGADGKPCDLATVGLLFPRSVRIGMIRYCGKESNLLDERELDLLRRDDFALTEYPLPIASDESWGNVLTVLAAMPRGATALSVGIDRVSLRNIIVNERKPGRTLRDRLTLMVREHARHTLGVESEARDSLGILAERLRDAARVCAGCGKPLTIGQRTWCGGDACRKRGRR